MNSNGAMGPDSWSAEANSPQDRNNPPHQATRTLSIPGGLPPTITPPPAVAQFRAPAAPLAQQTNSAQIEKKDEAPFPELGRAGSMLGWLVGLVSPRASPAATSSSEGSASTIGNLTLTAAARD